MNEVTAAGDIADVEAPELIRWKQSFVYRCRWPQDAQGWWIADIGRKDRMPA